MARTDIAIDPTMLTPTSMEAMANQATINIGIIGHVAHGKSALVKAITGTSTVRYKEELERNITIKLGYADAKIYKCNNPACPRPDCFKSYGSKMRVNPPCLRPSCGGTMELVRHVSFVDCPGHDVLMATMLNGAAVMDAAILLVAANEECPQPQTAEHLAAVETMKLENIIVVQNKTDLVTMDQATENHAQIQAFTQKTFAEKSPIIPTSAQLQFNIDAVVEHIYRSIPVPVRDFTSDPQMIVIRSFDINKPSDDISMLKGGVAGGSILKGVLTVGDTVEIRPGEVTRDENMQVRVRPLRTRIVSLHAESTKLQFAIPGGLIGAGTLLDPSLCRKNGLVGNVVGKPSSMPKVFAEITVSYKLLRRLLGVVGKDGARVTRLNKSENLLVNIGASSVFATVAAIKDDMAKLQLRRPACADIGESVAISRKVDQGFRLIGWAKIVKGKALRLEG
ncbi:eukaryotic translation initiation factor 2 subunit gamma [Coemansia sp. RSA 2708]|nr:eukaryotic translation initiation factor 2 subunit gamma [Coemansia sp. RSA 2708]